MQADWPGLKHANIIKTGERTFCIIAEWTDMDWLATARSNMIATLVLFRDTLEDLGGGLGVSDPVSGPVYPGAKIAVQEMAPWAEASRYLIRDREGLRRCRHLIEAEYSEFEHLPWVSAPARTPDRSAAPWAQSTDTDVASAFGHGP